MSKSILFSVALLFFTTPVVAENWLPAASTPDGIITCDADSFNDNGRASFDNKAKLHIGEGDIAVYTIRCQFPDAKANKFLALVFAMQCQAPNGTLLILGDHETEYGTRNWNANGNSLDDVMGRTLCATHQSHVDDPPQGPKSNAVKEQWAFVIDNDQGGRLLVDISSVTLVKPDNTGDKNVYLYGNFRADPGTDRWEAVVKLKECYDNRGQLLLQKQGEAEPEKLLWTLQGHHVYDAAAAWLCGYGEQADKYARKNEQKKNERNLP